RASRTSASTPTLRRCPTCATCRRPPPPRSARWPAPSGGRSAGSRPWPRAIWRRSRPCAERELPQHELGPALELVLLVRVALLGRPGGEVDRRLRVGGQDEQRLARLDLRHAPLRHRQGQRAGETPRVHGRHNRIVTSPEYSLAAVVSTGELE